VDPASPEPRIRPAESRADHEAAAEALALAFADDPAWAHLLPDDATRAEQLLLFFNAEVEHLDPEDHEVWLAEDGAGAAVWVRPGRWRQPISVAMRQMRPMARVFGRRLGLAFWAQLRFERRHPSSPRHWYLHYLGVEPRHQGRGLGGALMAPVLAECDAAGIPAYLESSTERNRRLYERNGFTLTRTFGLPIGGPPIREMWREPGPGSQL
jgi:GNAT superfamily N-acetyltransferase